MNIYVVRHGETLWNKEEVFRGRKDIPLNETGEKQAEKVGIYFSHRPIGRIVSSPLARARQTAGPISFATGVAVETMEEFTDINFGIWEGLRLREVEERYPADFTLWKTSPEKLRIETGETLAMVRERIAGGLEEAVYGQEGPIVVVTHRVICKLLVLHALNMGNEHFWGIKYDPGSITLLEGKDNRFVLVFSNDTCHQRADLPATAYRDF
jgi:probable phosphoglycerate mutase